MDKLEQLFLRDVAVDEQTQCWIWQGKRDRRNGRFQVGGHRVDAHRWAYEFYNQVSIEGAHLLRICETPSCVNPAHRSLRKGTRPHQLEERMLQRIQIRSDGCWIWTGKKSADGYGRIIIHQQFFYAHRVSYELHKGAIAPGLVLDHLCKNRICVNPNHLEPVTARENNTRVMRRAKDWQVIYKDLYREFKGAHTAEQDCWEDAEQRLKKLGLL
jgi:HNH endonuclease